METKPKRPAYQPYIPVHRRKQAAAELTSQQILGDGQQQQQQPQQSDSISTTEVKRRGRGQFRAPPSNTNVDNQADEKAAAVKIETIDLAAEFEVKVQLEPIQQQPQETRVEKHVEKEEKEEEEKEDWEALLDEPAEEVEVLNKPITKNGSNKKVEPTIVELEEKVPDDLTTVLDCYDFPTAFKSHHLQGVFREYEKMKGGYQIKWMDDSRALIIFDHPATARKAYIDLLSSSIVKVKPYTGQIEIKPTGPVPRRPVTTDMVARRLVHGALGVRTVKTPEQRAAEKELLQAARDQREKNRLESQKRQKEVASAFDE